RLVQRGNLVVEGLASLVEATAGIAEQVVQGFRGNGLAILDQVGGVLQQVEQAPAIAVGGGQQDLQAFFRQLQASGAQAPLLAQGALHQPAQRRLVQAAQHIDASPGQQRIVQLEGRVLGGGADEDQGAVFHVGQKGVLLALIEAVHL